MNNIDVLYDKVQDLLKESKKSDITTELMNLIVMNINSNDIVELRFPNAEKSLEFKMKSDFTNLLDRFNIRYELSLASNGRFIFHIPDYKTKFILISSEDLTEYVLQGGEKIITFTIASAMYNKY